jgi:predicted transcriptional regulator
MSIAKEEVMRFIEKLPDDYSVDDIMAELYFKQQVEQGLRDAEDGRVYSHEQVKKMVQEWRKSSGRN